MAPGEPPMKFYRRPPGRQIENSNSTHFYKQEVPLELNLMTLHGGAKKKKQNPLISDLLVGNSNECVKDADRALELAISVKG
jgi:hypothetical protein